ncbi:MAG: GGDEF domain-containing protein, partial [Guyparkeria sp.]|uniref:GGDEF domain-containing protein n=1 Tax=Guyparkeria sp. TaxID=2035736 RepID=UPI00397B62D2
GGEEFVVLLPGQSLAQATVVAERIREAFRGNSASELGPGGTVSLGVAQLREGDTANTLLARADAALYHAKERGRDRVELAH